MLTSTNTIIYDVYDSGNEVVIITIEIGNGQIGSSIVKIENNNLGDFENSFSLEIGKNKDLKGKQLSIITMIHDINPSSDKIEMSIQIEGGKNIHNQVIFDSSLPSSGSIANSNFYVFFY